MSSISDQGFEIDIQKTISLVLIVILALSTAAFFVQTQSLKEDQIDHVRQIKQLNDTLEEQQSLIKEQNKTINLETERNHKLKMENGDLRYKVSRPLVKMDYRSRDGSSSSMTVDIDFMNYGNRTAENVRGVCDVYRKGADQKYDSFSVEKNQVENQTSRTVSTQPSISEQVKSSDKISCEVTSCNGDCQLLDESLKRPYSNHPRLDFN